MRLIYMIAADVLRALGWEVEINEKDSYCLYRGLLVLSVSFGSSSSREFPRKSRELY